MGKRQTDGTLTRETGDPPVALPNSSSQPKIVHDPHLSPFKRSHPQTTNHALRPDRQAIGGVNSSNNIVFSDKPILSTGVRVTNNVKGAFKTCPGFWVDSSVGELRVTHTHEERGQSLSHWKSQASWCTLLTPVLGEWRGPVAEAAPNFHVSRHKGNSTQSHAGSWSLASTRASICLHPCAHAFSHKRKENTFQFQQWSLSVCCRIIKTEVENPKNQSVWFFITPPAESL